MAEQYQQAIRTFLAQRRIAVIGVSRSPKGFGAMLFREFLKKGYDAVPVNPNASEVEGVRCFARVQDIEPRPDAALIMLPARAMEPVVKDCVDAGVTRVWLYGTSGPRQVEPRALEACRNNQVEVVPGYCPFMFLPGTAWFHRAHGWVAKLTGSYPS